MNKLTPSELAAATLDPDFKAYTTAALTGLLANAAIQSGLSIDMYIKATQNKCVEITVNAAFAYGIQAVRTRNRLQTHQEAAQDPSVSESETTAAG